MSTDINHGFDTIDESPHVIRDPARPGHWRIMWTSAQGVATQSIDMVGNCGDSVVSNTDTTAWDGRRHLYDYLGGAAGSGGTVFDWRGSEYLRVGAVDTLPGSGYADFLAAYVDGGIKITVLHWGAVTLDGQCSPSHVAQAFTLGTDILAVGDGEKPRQAASFRLAELLRGSTKAVFEVELTGAMPVRLDVFDLTGRRVSTLLDGRLPMGKSRVSWDGHDMGGSAVRAGVFYARLVCPAGKHTVSMVVLK